MSNVRQENINKFYTLLDKVIEKFPTRSLADTTRRQLPEKGVYFFFERGEIRESLKTSRVVRIGTHAAIANSNASLYQRIYNHKGSHNLTGNHRGSVFRKLIGYSLSNKEGLCYQYWGDKSKKGNKLIKEAEESLEVKVSQYLHSMTFTVLEVPGPSSKENDRAFIEQNSIALLSNFGKVPIDNCSSNWLGLLSKDQKVVSSGLWNSDHVDKNIVNDGFLTLFELHISNMANY